MSRHSFNLREIGAGIAAQLVVVMPIYNEATNIAKVISAWSATLRPLGIPFQIIALDDGSRDDTHQILLQLEERNPELMCVVSKPNAGHGSTCRIGYEIAINSMAEWILQIDSDGQCEPKYFADFWTKRVHADCVFGMRTSRDDGLPRIMTSAICRIGSSLICGRDLKDANVPYRLIRASVLRRALEHIPPNFNIHNVALTYVLKKLPDIRWDYVAIHFPDRQGGENSINLLKVMTWGAEMLLELLRIRVRADLD
ncbi:MAG: glycosyltransferase family 2 protein [Chthoniobacterales bacterium]|nr:glycosyltransferase family 2 protein [Chthoniobacterales bacterium]